MANSVINWSTDCSFFFGIGWYQSENFGRSTSLFPTSIISVLTADELNGVNIASIRRSYTYLLLRFGQFSDTPLFLTTFGQRSGNFSDIGRTRTFFSETDTTTRNPPSHFASLAYPAPNSLLKPSWRLPVTSRAPTRHESANLAMKC